MAQLEEIVREILYATGTDAVLSDEDSSTIILVDGEEEIVGSWDQTSSGSVFFLVPDQDGEMVKVSFTASQIERIEAEMDEDPEVDLLEVKSLTRKIEALVEAIEEAQEFVASSREDDDVDAEDDEEEEAEDPTWPARKAVLDAEMAQEVRRVQATFKSLGEPIAVQYVETWMTELSGEGVEVQVCRDPENMEFVTYVRRKGSEPTLWDGDAAPAPTATPSPTPVAQETTPTASGFSTWEEKNELAVRFIRYIRGLGFEPNRTATFLTHHEFDVDDGLFDVEVRPDAIKLSINAQRSETPFFAWDALPDAATVKEFYEGEWHRESVRLMDEVAIPRHWLWQLESIACSIRNPHDTAEHRLLFTAIAQAKAHADKLQINHPLFTIHLRALGIANRILGGDLSAKEDLANLLFDEMTTLRQAWWHINEIDRRLGINIPQYA